MRCRRLLPLFLVLLGACYSTPAYDGPLPPPEGFAQVLGGGERINHLSVHLVAIDEWPVDEKLPRKGKLKAVAVDIPPGNHIVVVEWREYTSRFEWGLFSMRALSGSERDPASYAVVRSGRSRLPLRAAAGRRYLVRWWPIVEPSGDDRKRMAQAQEALDRDRWRVEIRAVPPSETP